MKKKKGLGKGITLVKESEEESLTYIQAQDMINAMFEIVFDDSAYSKNCPVFQKPLTKLEKALK